MSPKEDPALGKYVECKGVNTETRLSTAGYLSLQSLLWGGSPVKVRKVRSIQARHTRGECCGGPGLTDANGGDELGEKGSTEGVVGKVGLKYSRMSREMAAEEGETGGTSGAGRRIKAVGPSLACFSLGRRAGGGEDGEDRPKSHASVRLPIC